jgi:hypothetical protein
LNRDFSDGGILAFLACNFDNPSWLVYQFVVPKSSIISFPSMSNYTTTLRQMLYPKSYTTGIRWIVSAWYIRHQSLI